MIDAKNHERHKEFRNCVLALSQRLPALSVAFKLIPVFTEHTPRFSTDGTYIFLNPGAWDHSTLNQRRSMVAHTALVCIYGHVWRKGNRNTKLWWDASNIVINLSLGDLEMATGGYVNTTFARMDDGNHHYFYQPQCVGSGSRPSVEKVYSEMIREHDPSFKPSTGGGGGGGDGDGEEDIPASLNEFLKACPSVGATMEHKPEMKKDAPATFELTKMDEGAWKTYLADRRVSGDLKGIGKEVDYAFLHQSAKKDTSVDWRDVLREHIEMSLTGTEDYSWNRPNNKYGSATEFLMPSSIGTKIGDVVIAIDTSGSTTEYQDTFLEEVRNIVGDMNPDSVHFMQIDTRVHHYQVLEADDEALIESDVTGGGGSDMTPAFEKVSYENISPNLMVFLTDLHVYMPETPPPYDVLWVIPKGLQEEYGDHEYNFGTKVVVDMPV